MGDRISKSKIGGFGLIIMVSCLILAFVWVTLDLSGTILAQKKTPPGQDKKVDSTQDMPLCFDFDEADSKLIPNVNPLCDSIKQVDAYAGRNWGITIKIHKRISDPYLHLLSLDPLPWIEGDPEVGTGIMPVLGSGGGDWRISEPEFQVALGVNVQDMAPGASLWTIARLRFRDDDGNFCTLFWGPGSFGPYQRSNESAPTVHVQRTDDGTGLRNWYVTSQVEDRGGYVNVHTAFLWVVNPATDIFEYSGAYNVPFIYSAIQE
jgi:hypothetical protein